MLAVAIPHLSGNSNSKHVSLFQTNAEAELVKMLGIETMPDVERVQPGNRQE